MGSSKHATEAARSAIAARGPTRLQSGAIDRAVVVLFLAASLVGAIVGGRVAERRDPAALQRWFVVLLAVAACRAIRSALAL
jgi:uncharacterized membrane protein YfcA